MEREVTFDVEDDEGDTDKNDEDESKFKVSHEVEVQIDSDSIPREFGVGGGRRVSRVLEGIWIEFPDQLMLDLRPGRSDIAILKIVIVVGEVIDLGQVWIPQASLGDKAQ